MSRPARPVLKPGLRRVWRGPTTLQLGLGERHAVVVADAGPEVSAFLDRLDGSRTADALAAAAREARLDPDVALDLVDRLAAHGVVDDAAGVATVRGLSATERDRRAPDLAAWGLATTAPGGAAAVHAGRHAARVDVHGAGRVGALAAALLTHAGVGELHVHDPEPLRAADVPAPWARSVAEDAGAAPARAEVALDVCEQLAPSLRTRRRPARPAGRVRRPSVALLAPVDTAGTVDLDLRDALLRSGVPHLPAFVRETVGVVGPLVLPGRTACLRCVDLARTDRDRHWPRVLAQLTPLPDSARARRGTVADACDGVLAAAVAAQAALQVLALLDGATPSAAGHSIETDLVDGTTRARGWQQHPACGCGWD